MERRCLLAANWKMNGSLRDLPKYFSDFAANTPNNLGVEMVFALPYLFLGAGKEQGKEKGRGWLQVASQNVHFMEKGAYTGEVSFAMLKEAGISWVVIGHSERRQYFGDDDTSVAKKLAAACKEQVKAIVCIGESLGERKEGRTKEVLSKQLKGILELAPDPKDFVVAYEPVWAIGTDLAATPEQAEEVHSFIRSLFAQKIGSKANALRIVYGGSMNEKNCAELVAKPNIDGGLVGGASLDPIKFAQMAKTLKEVKNC